MITLGYTSLCLTRAEQESLLLAVKKPNATVTGCEKGQRAGNSENCGPPGGEVGRRRGKSVKRPLRHTAPGK